MKFWALSVLGVAILAGCSAQGGRHDLVKTASGQTCNLDTAAICNAVRNAPVNMGGLTADNQFREANSPATTWENFSYNLPSGNTVEVACDIRTRDGAVIYARLEKGPQFTDRDIEFAKQQGLCIEQ